jgi:hypothetical protein
LACDTQAANRHRLLEELQRDALWQFSSMLEPQRAHSSSGAGWRRLTPQEAESALLAYVRMAAAAEQQHSSSSSRQHARQRDRLLPSDVAAELQALYTLAAAHQEPGAAGKGQRRGGAAHVSLSGADFLELLGAYAALDECRAGAGAFKDPRRSSIDCGGPLTWLAFARLADAPEEEEQQHKQLQEQQQQQQQGSPQQQQQQNGQQAPGQLQQTAPSSLVVGSAAQPKQQSPTRSSRQL